LCSFASKHIRLHTHSERLVRTLIDWCFFSCLIHFSLSSCAWEASYVNQSKNIYQTKKLHPSVFWCRKRWKLSSLSWVEQCFCTSVLSMEPLRELIKVRSVKKTVFVVSFSSLGAKICVIRFLICGPYVCVYRFILCS